MLWFNPGGQWSPTQMITHSPPCGVGERFGRVKVRKLLDWDKDGLIGKAKIVCASKVKYGIHPLSVSRQLFSHLQESRDSLCVVFTWEEKCHNREHFPLASVDPICYCWAWRRVVWGVPFVGWGQLSQPCPLTASCAPPACSLVGRCEAALMLY